MKNLRKNSDTQHLLSAHIPWYRTRKFWGVVILIQLTIGFILFLPSLISPHINIGLPSALLAITGYTTYYYISFLIIGHNNVLGFILYTLGTATILFKIGKHRETKPAYPIIYLVFACISIIISYLFIGAF